MQTTALIVAAQQGHAPIVEALLKAGFDRGKFAHTQLPSGHEGDVSEIVG